MARAGSPHGCRTLDSCRRASGRGYRRGMALTTAAVERSEASRRRLEAIAYRMPGFTAEAEDAVQEAEGVHD
nr:hypothetical protein GCM10020063_029490 [Dactylosporangium thailandense]